MSGKHLQTQQTGQEEKKQTAPFNYLGGPSELEPTLRDLHDLISASIPSDADYNNVMSKLADFSQETSIVIQLMRDQRDEKATELSTLQQDIQTANTRNELIYDLWERLEEHFLDETSWQAEEAFDEGYERAEEELAEAINLLLGYDTQGINTVGQQVAKALMDATDLPNNAVAQEVLKELLLKVSGQWKDEADE